MKSNLIHDLSFYFTPNPFQVPETSQVSIVLGIHIFGFALLSFARKIQKDDLCVIPGPLYVFFSFRLSRMGSNFIESHLNCPIK